MLIIADSLLSFLFLLRVTKTLRPAMDEDTSDTRLVGTYCRYLGHLKLFFSTRPGSTGPEGAGAQHGQLLADVICQIHTKHGQGLQVPVCQGVPEIHSK